MRNLRDALIALTVILFLLPVAVMTLLPFLPMIIASAGLLGTSLSSFGADRNSQNS